MTGIWTGVQSMYDWLKNALYGFFSSIMPDWVRQALGISSPSRVFAEIGGYTMLGMAQGMQKSAGQVMRTARNIAGQLTTAFNPDLSGSLRPTAAAVGRQGQSGGVVINQTVINPVAEPGSQTINRGLQLAGAMGVV